jgi:hypothetical protein
MKRIFAALGLGISTTPVQQSVKTATEQVAIKNGQDIKKTEADIFGSYAGGMLRQIMRNTGHTPYEWGISRACRRMVLKNKKIACRSK